MKKSEEKQPMLQELAMEEEHMEKCYNAKNPFVRYVHRKRLTEIINSIPNKKELKILDAGCGEGHLLEKLKEREYVNLYGTDITKAALEDAEKRVPNAFFSLQNLCNLDYPNNFFDVVVCSEVLEHIVNYKKAIKELKRVLRKNGLLIITFPNETVAIPLRLMFLRRPTIKDHVNSFTNRQIKGEVKLQGLKETSVPFSILPIVNLIIFQNS